jgi:alpha-1,2-mannosyltransferase
VQAEAEAGPIDAVAQDGPPHPPWRRILAIAAVVVAALFFAFALTAYLVDQALHIDSVLTWYDLNVYNDAGLITRQLPSILYTWELKAGVRFTYTPCAALLFAAGSLIPFWTLRWIMTISSLVAIPLTGWLTLGAMGRRGAGRIAATLAVSALALWTEPVAKALYLGQIEPLLMLLVVWDLTRQDSSRWKGIGIGIAAGIKLVPLLFIPYLMVAGKVRHAVMATGTFIATIVIGFIVLPGPSASYWLTGYFMRPGRTGSVHSLVNQSLLGALSRLYGTVGPVQPAWLPLALAVSAGGLIGGALLSRTGRHVQGWTLVGITAVLVSPISWDHHWVWIVPVLALLAGLAMIARPFARAGYILAIVLISGIIGSWPWDYSGPKAFVPRRGLLGWFVMPPQVTQIEVVHGWQLLTWNLWVAVGIVIYLGLLASAIVAWRKRPRNRAAFITAQSPIDALLARAGAVLRGGPLTESGQSGSHALASSNGGVSDNALVDRIGGDIEDSDGPVGDRAGSNGAGSNGAGSNDAGSNGAGSNGAGSNGAGSNGEIGAGRTTAAPRGTHLPRLGRWLRRPRRMRTARGERSGGPAAACPRTTEAPALGDPPLGGWPPGQPQ